MIYAFIEGVFVYREIKMFIACTFAEIDIGRVFSTFLPYIVVLFIGLLIVSYFPWLTLVIPRMFFM